MKNSYDTIENRTRDLPTCSVVPQPTALPRSPKILSRDFICTNHRGQLWLQFPSVIAEVFRSVSDGYFRTSRRIKGVKHRIIVYIISKYFSIYSIRSNCRQLKYSCISLHIIVAYSVVCCLWLRWHTILHYWSSAGIHKRLRALISCTYVYTYSVIYVAQVMSC